MKIAATSFVLAAGFFAATSLTFAKPEYAKKEGVKCVACHTAMGKKDLNDVGKCYKDKKDLKVCQTK